MLTREEIKESAEMSGRMLESSGEGECLFKRVLNPAEVDKRYRYTLHINDGFYSDSAWYKALLKLRSTINPNDELEVILNSPGGSAYILEEVRVIISTLNVASKKIWLAGNVASAASLLAFAVKWDKIYISVYTNFLVHTVSTFLIGKLNDMTSVTKHLESYVAEIYRATYKDVLTKDEIKEVVNGKEFYLSGRELYERALSTKRYSDIVELV